MLITATDDYDMPFILKMIISNAVIRHQTDTTDNSKSIVIMGSHNSDAVIKSVSHSQPVADNKINNFVPEVYYMRSKEEFTSKPESTHRTVTESIPHMLQKCGKNHGVDDKSNNSKAQKTRIRA